MLSPDQIFIFGGGGTPDQHPSNTSGALKESKILVTGMWQCIADSLSYTKHVETNNRLVLPPPSNLGNPGPASENQIDYKIYFEKRSRKGSIFIVQIMDLHFQLWSWQPSV